MICIMITMEVDLSSTYFDSQNDQSYNSLIWASFNYNELVSFSWDIWTFLKFNMAMKFMNNFWIAIYSLLNECRNYTFEMNFWLNVEIIHFRWHHKDYKSRATKKIRAKPTSCGKQWNLFTFQSPYRCTFANMLNFN